MAGSPVFSINVNNGLIPAKPKYLARLEIYKGFQDRLTILNRLIGEILLKTKLKRADFSRWFSPEVV